MILAGDAERATLSGEGGAAAVSRLESKRALPGDASWVEKRGGRAGNGAKGRPKVQQRSSQCPLRSAYKPAVAKALC